MPASLTRAGRCGRSRCSIVMTTTHGCLVGADRAVSLLMSAVRSPTAAVTNTTIVPRTPSPCLSRFDRRERRFLAGPMRYGRVAFEYVFPCGGLERPRILRRCAPTAPQGLVLGGLGQAGAARSPNGLSVTRLACSFFSSCRSSDVLRVSYDCDGLDIGPYGSPPSCLEEPDRSDLSHRSSFGEPQGACGICLRALRHGSNSTRAWRTRSR